MAVSASAPFPSTACTRGFPPDADPQRVYLEHMAFTPAYGRLWKALAEPLRQAGAEPRLAITELQIFTRRPNVPNNATLTEAIWTASIINEAIRSDGLVEAPTHSALVNHGGRLRKERGVVFAQPVWWTTHLYAGAPEGLRRVALETTSPTFAAQPYRLAVAGDAAYLDAVGLTDESGSQLVLFMVNRHPDRALRVALEVGGRGFEHAAIATLTDPSFMVTTHGRLRALCGLGSRRGPGTCGS